MPDEERIRHSVAAEARIVTDPDEQAHVEAANALRQAERVRDYILQTIDGRPFKLRPSILLDLNRCAIEGLSAYAGVWRPAGIGIGKSEHAPPEGAAVPGLIEELCDYINDGWSKASAIHLSAMVMWRLNWIHPFSDGNGRTSRASSYLVLCAHEKAVFPGTRTIPAQIVDNRGPYYAALEAADTAFKRYGTLREGLVDEMEELIGNMFAQQLASAFDSASGYEKLSS